MLSPKCPVSNFPLKIKHISMEQIRNFLESSTIHGLSHISTTRNCTRVLWIVVVISGFSVSGILIYQSFNGWAESPVKTTIETRPIREITFPKITVCPPKNTFTDLNYDLISIENMTLPNNTRKELSDYAVKLSYHHLYDTIITNLGLINDDDRFYGEFGIQIEGF